VSLYKVDHLSLPPPPQIAAAEKTPDQSLAGILQTRRPIKNGADNVWEEDPR